MQNPLEKILNELEVLAGLRQPEPISDEVLWGEPQESFSHRFTQINTDKSFEFNYEL